MKPWKRLLALTAGTSLATAGLGASHAAALTSDCSEFTVSVARVTHPASDGSLLSQFASEQLSAANYGFTGDDGIVFRAAPSDGDKLVGVWRLYNPKTYDFTWAAEGADMDRLESAGYVAQFRQFYATTVNNNCVSTVYRMAKGDKTRIAVGAADRDRQAKNGWSVTDTGVFFAVPGASPSNPAPEPVPPAEPEPEPQPGGSDDEFTVAVFPDTQREVWTDADARFKNRSTWLVDNKSSLNLKFATHIGDVVDWGAVSPVQFTRAKNGLSPLNGKIPYSLTVGNHDTGAVCQGGSACPDSNANVAVRDTSAFNDAFDKSFFTNLKGQFEAGKVDNTYSTFEAAGQKWMVLNLELWPRQAAIDWAKKVVAANPEHNVIVATHHYLEANGAIGTSNGGYGATSPKHLFDTFIKQFPNIKVVLSGHVGGGASRVDTGVNGNKILSLLQCYHSQTTNPVRLIKFNVAEGTIATWVYAPHTKETLAAESTSSGFDLDR